MDVIQAVKGKCTFSVQVMGQLAKLFVEMGSLEGLKDVMIRILFMMMGVLIVKLIKTMIVKVNLLYVQPKFVKMGLLKELNNVMIRILLKLMDAY